MIPRVGRQRRQQAGRVSRLRIIQNRRLQRYAVQVDSVLVQHPAEHAAAGGAVGFAKKEFGRVPPVVRGQITLDELLERACVLVDAPKIPVLVRGDRRRISRADGIDEDEVASVQQAVGIRLERIGGRRREVREVGLQPHGCERAQQHIDGRGSRPAVVEEGDRSRAEIDSVGGEGDVENLRRCFRARGIDDRQMTGGGRVGDRPASQRRRMMCDRRALAHIGDGVVRTVAVSRLIKKGLVRKRKGRLGGGRHGMHLLGIWSRKTRVARTRSPISTKTCSQHYLRKAVRSLKGRPESKIISSVRIGAVGVVASEQHRKLMSDRRKLSISRRLNSRSYGVNQTRSSKTVTAHLRRAGEASRLAYEPPVGTAACCG